MTSPQALVAEFHEKFGVPNNLSEYPDVRESRFDLRYDLIREESRELEDEFQAWNFSQGNLVNLAKEAADLVYVVYGMALEFGIDLDAVLAEVHRSNMTKTSENKRADGKIQKGPDYEEADIASVLFP